MSNIYCIKLIFNYFNEKNMSEENINQEFRMKNIDETTNYFIEKIN